MLFPEWIKITLSDKYNSKGYLFMEGKIKMIVKLYEKLCDIFMESEAN